MISSSSMGFPVAAISSARDFILLKYSAIDIPPFVVVVSVILVVTERARGLGRQQLLDAGPSLDRRRLVGDVREDVLGKGREQIAQHICHPLVVGFVGHLGLLPIGALDLDL